MATGFRTYADFWPFYLQRARQAGDPDRSLFRHHRLGAGAGRGRSSTQSWWWLLAVPFFGYGPAWFGHFFIEKNKPATFQAPFWSLISDYRMCGLWLSGRLGHELMKYQIRG